MVSDEAGNTTAHVQRCLERLHTGDQAARADLLRHACARLTHLSRKMLHDYPGVHRWEETDDVFQNASVRLWQALQVVTPESVPHFFRLAALHIRRELIDLARSYQGPQGLGANQASGPSANGSLDDTPRRDPSELTHEPGRLAIWSEFHRHVEALPEDEREIFDLLWYQGLTQPEAAQLLGTSERTVQRRWQLARIKLHRMLGGEPPG